MFLSTTGLGEWSVHNWVSHADTNREKDEDAQHKRESSHYNRAQNEKRFMQEQICYPNCPQTICYPNFPQTIAAKQHKSCIWSK